MSNEINISYDPGSTIYAILRDKGNGNVWCVTTSAWEAWGASGHVAGDYDIPMTDRSGGLYQADMPSSIAYGNYIRQAYLQAGGSPAGPPTDLIIADDVVEWDGSAVVTGGVPDTASHTRAQIKTLVDGRTGRATEKNTLINFECDQALKLAIHKHPFRDATTTKDDISITENAVSVDISTIKSLVDIISSRIIETGTDSYASLIMKDRNWWDKNVINPSSNMKGWPKYGLRDGSMVKLDGPANSGLSLRLRVTQEYTFGSDDSQCPVPILDAFVTAYVTAEVFLAIENHESYVYWHRKALGPGYDGGVVGGLLLDAINSDKTDPSEEFKAERAGLAAFDKGVSIRNMIEGHPGHDTTRRWY